MFWSTHDVVLDLAAISARYKALEESLDERSRRLKAAAESQVLGRGGISAASKATGISRIWRGRRLSRFNGRLDAARGCFRLHGIECGTAVANALANEEDRRYLIPVTTGTW